MTWTLKTCSVLLTTLVLAIVLSTASADDAVSKQDKLKAAYLLNFLTFIEWPNTPDDKPLTPLYICLQDSAPFDQFFRSLINIKPGANSKRELYVSRLSDATHCDLTYFHRTPSSENSQVEGSIVVLSSDQVSQKNAAIIFYVNDNKLRFEIVMNNIRKYGVTVSSELLKLAKLK